MEVIAEAPPHVPLVLAGDMNEWYRGAVTLKEAHRIFGEPPAPVAFPSFAPMLALTRMWVRPRAALQSITVHRTALSRKASDHLPIKATIDLDQLHAATGS
jgi:endonuclease/exonuclease/phosphatase family metal-dependent hydrolase